MNREQKFFNALRDVFVGAKIEGESGYINLMRIKSRYYTEGVFPKLQKDINEALKPFPGFRDELFEKLYDFFHRYFSESGSIYFRYTPLHQNVYEKVYTDDKDVMLFWKTHMLYYVKTDRLFKSMEVEVDDRKFFFDVAELEHKKANEKRTIVYSYKEKRKGGALVFAVAYSEKGKKTKTDDILKSLRKNGDKINEDTLERAFRVFEKQSEVDYFINKDAEAFLEEQFNLWLYQYVFSGVSEWTEARIKQLQVLKDIAFKVIAFISQFEDELVKIWNKPKFVFHSNYVIALTTLKSLVDSKMYEEIREATFKQIGKVESYRNDTVATVEEVFKYPLQKIYVEKVSVKNDSISIRYVKLFKTEEDRASYLAKNPRMKIFWSPIVDRGRTIEGFAATYTSDNLTKEVSLERAYIDTAYFDPGFKLKLLEAISANHSLDEVLDGYLIKSENHQALNTLRKFTGKVNLIYIDPPFNAEGAFAYIDRFKDSTWLCLIANRIASGKEFLTPKGSLYVHLDHNCNYLARLVLDGIFKREPQKEIVWNTGESLSGFKTQAQNWIRQHDTLLYYSNQNGPYFAKMHVKNDDAKVEGLGWLDIFKDEEERLFVYKYEGDTAPFSRRLKRHAIPLVKTKMIGDIWNDVYSLMYTQNMTRENWGEDNTQKPENLLRRIIQSATEERDFVKDYFLGSGTTIAAAHKLNRRWIGVEMAHFVESIVLKRMKTVVFGDVRPKLSEDLNWHGGGFFKYYELEQYEDALRSAKYKDGDLFDDPNKDPYHQYVFLRDPKMLDALEVDTKKNTVKVDLSKLYNGIDIAETLSNLTGKWIKRITAESVEFEDGEVVDTKNLDWKQIKPLIWW